MYSHMFTLEENIIVNSCYIQLKLGLSFMEDKYDLY